MSSSPSNQHDAPNSSNADTVADKERMSVSGGICNFGYGGVSMAKGYSWLGCARGPFVTGNVFLSAALIYLASEEVGCIEEGGEVTPNCDERVFGLFKPAALVTWIAVMSGLVSAFFMPLAGAVIDYTDHRWATGVVSSLGLTVCTAVQIGINSNNWFYLAIVQAIGGVLYHTQVLATYSYLPDMSRILDDRTWTMFTSNFTMAQFGSQTIILVIVIAISTSMTTDDVGTARIALIVCLAFCVAFFTPGWYHMPQVAARNKADPDKNLFLQGFAQNWRTAKQINKEYKRSLRPFLLGILFAEPATQAFTAVAVVFLSDRLQMSGNQIGIMLFSVLLSMIPGAFLFHVVAHRTNPNTSICFSMFMLFVATAVGAWLLTPENAIPGAYIWGSSIGIFLGCYYPSSKIFLSLVVPHGREAEVTGFYVYCTQLFVWLPPLIFSAIVEANVDMRIGVVAMGSFGLFGIVMFQMAAPFDEVLEEIHDKNKLLSWSDRGAKDDGMSERTTSSFQLSQGTLA